MRIALYILIALHGLIHLFGFLKAFKIAEFNGITQPISKTFGILWLVAFLGFAITLVLMRWQSNYWWAISFLAVIASQFLIFNYWSNTKFGTIANLIILIVAIAGFSSFNFQHKVNTENQRILENSTTANSKINTKVADENLPIIVQKWLNTSGAISNKAATKVYITQDLNMVLKPSQKKWSTAKAEQYFTINPPAFNWFVNVKMNSWLNAVGRDKFENGKGEMIIKLFSLFNVANAKNNEKIDEATLQRYLAEIVWFPSAALSNYIQWETVSTTVAKATMQYNGTEGSGEFHFDEQGNFKKFVAMRYKEANDENPTKWTVIATKIEERNGIKIPVECKASWELENGNWTWLKLKITNIKTNF